MADPTAVDSGRRIRVDYSSYYEEQAKKTPDPGVYAGKITDVQQTVSKAGNPMLVWSAVITDKRYAGTPFKLRTVLTPSALWKLEESQKALGLVDENGKPLDDWDLDDVIGAEIGLKIVQGEYQGESRPELHSFVKHFESDDKSSLPF